MEDNKSKMKLNLLKNVKDIHFKEKLNKISKPVVVSSMLVGGYVTYQTGNWIEQVRYPIKLEYSIISQCANGYKSGYLSSSSKKHIDICICALEKTMNDVGVDESSNVFNSEFRSNLYKCK
ncbi:hypothetical protein [Frederiksenia canicola]